MSIQPVHGDFITAKSDVVQVKKESLTISNIHKVFIQDFKKTLNISIEIFFLGVFIGVISMLIPIYTMYRLNTKYYKANHGVMIYEESMNGFDYIIGNGIILLCYPLILFVGLTFIYGKKATESIQTLTFGAVILWIAFNFWIYNGRKNGYGKLSGYCTCMFLSFIVLVLQFGIWCYSIYKIKHLLISKAWFRLMLAIFTFDMCIQFFPIVKWTLNFENNVLKGLIIVIIFPFIREIFYSIVRNCCLAIYCDHDSRERIALILLVFQVCASLAARYLLTTIKDFQTMVISSIFLGIIEIVLRQTFLFRDRLVYAFFHTKEETEWRFGNKTYKAYCGLVIVCDALSEIIAIVVSHIYITITISDPFWGYSRTRSFFGQDIAVFYSISYLTVSCLTQLVIEFFVDLLCLQIEHALLDVPAIKSWYNIPKHFTWYLLYYTFLLSTIMSSSFNHRRCGQYDMTNFTVGMDYCKYCPEEMMNDDLWYICVGSLNGTTIRE